MNRQFGSTLALASALVLSGCGDLANMVASSGPADARPARVAFTASIASPAARSAADVVSLRVTTSYLLAGGLRDTIGTQTLALTSASTQSVPIPVDLAGCLADSNREGAATDGGCSVVLELALSVNDAVVDRQAVGPLRLKPGATTEVSQPVTLFEIASVTVAPTGTVSLIVGGTTTVTPSVKDSRGQVVTGRAVGWSTDAPTVATVDGNGKVTAIGAGQARITATLGSLSGSTLVQVVRPPVSLVISPTTGSGTGVVRSVPAGIDCRIVAGTVSGACAVDFAADLQVTLTSVADAGQQFGSWGGACVGSSVGASCTLTMAQARTASAQFTAMRRVTVASAGTDGRGRVTGGFGMDCRIDGAGTTGTCAVDVADGTPVTLTSVADGANAGVVAQVFGGWSGDCAAASGTSCTLTPTGGNRAASVGFLGGKAVSVVMTGIGGGSVTSTAGLSCIRSGDVTSGTCAQTVSHGTTVTLVPNADPQSVFVGWSGACAGQVGDCTLSMTQARSAIATYTRRTVSLNMILTGGGNGVVTVNGISGCDRTNTTFGTVTCVRDYDIGTVVTLSANAGAGTDFLGNTGDCVGMTSCTLVMSQSRTVTSAFAGTVLVTLTIEGLASGSGVLRSTESTPRINCAIVGGQPSGSGCVATVPVGTSITLQGTGNVGNALTFWGGSCTGRVTHECTLVVNAPMRASAGFSAAIDVEVRLSGPGAGSITFAPAGAPSQAPCVVSVPGTPVSCRYSLPGGTNAVLRGFSAPGWRFDGFIGPCVESVSSTPVQECTYRGIGFLRVFTAGFIP
ncbi:MAG: Ig-like domain-containing protein [Gemmatimonadaceae bacterium]|nr:Ig-like domain-containing protein [Gemmatimonadaceae bacterium]